MNKLKFYVLCSKGIPSLKRHLNTIPKEDLFVVINTLDKKFEDSASLFCKENDIEYAITESNGKCGKGKNAVFDIFEQSDNDYCCPIDGDDYITEYGYEVYTTLVTGDKVPDVVAITNQKGLKRSLATFFGDYGTEEDPEKIPAVEFYPFKRDDTWWNCVLSLPDGNAMRRWATQCRKYISPKETHLRLTLLSKKAVSLFRFNEDLAVGEDTLMYLNYKNAWSKGLIDLVHFDENPRSTYIYDTRMPGVVLAEKQKGDEQKKPIPWLKDLAIEYNKYEAGGKMVPDVVPVING